MKLAEITPRDPKTDPLLVTARLWQTNLTHYFWEFVRKFPDSADAISQIERVFRLHRHVPSPLQLAILPWYYDGLVLKSKFLSVFNNQDRFGYCVSRGCSAIVAWWR